MNDPLDSFFEGGAFSRLPARTGADCPADDVLAGFVDRTLTGADRLRVERHALGCPDCHTALSFVADLRAERAGTRGSLFRVVARLLERGLQLVNAAEHRLLPSSDPALAGLGNVRGSFGNEAFVLTGPGGGLDELVVQRQPSGAVRLVVRGDPSVGLEPGEVTSIVFECGEAVREKRPFTGEPLSFEPLEPGTLSVRLLARAPGCPSRELSRATVELVA